MSFNDTQTTIETEPATIEEREETTLEALCRLDNNSRGEWVRCVCTEVDPDELRFVFETVHDRMVTKTFDVPRVYEGSDVQRFFERVGYSAEAASVMEGDTFWMNMGDERVIDSPPNRWDSAKSSLQTLLNGGIELPRTLHFTMMYVGGVMLWPIGVLYLGHHLMKQEDWFIGLIFTIAVGGAMALLTMGMYETFVAPLSWYR